jgi:hypothetical protein
LVWDCVEPLRPKLVRAVFEYVAAHELSLAPPLAKEIVEVAVRTISVRECVKVVEWLVKLF